MAGAGGAVLIAVLLGLVATTGFPSAATVTTSTISAPIVTRTFQITTASTGESGASSSGGQNGTFRISSTATLSSSAQTAVTTTAAVTSTTTAATTATSPCGSPGVYCGSIQLSSGSLAVNGNSSVLQVTVTEVGNSYIGSATVYVNGTVIGVPPASQYEPPGNIILDVQPGQQAVLVLTIQTSTIAIQSGRTYSVLVYAWLGPPGQRASSGLPQSINVTAT